MPAPKKKAATKRKAKAKAPSMELVPKEEVQTTGKSLSLQQPGQQLPSLQSESMEMLGMIERLASNPDVDVDKMKQIMDMKEHMFNKQAEVEFNAAMARVQAKLEPVVAKSENKQTESKYAKINAIVKVAAPIYTQEGFALSFNTDACPVEEHSMKGWFRIICEATHSAGFAKKYHVDLPPDLAGIAGKVNKTGIHAFKSTLSYGKNMLICMIFNIVTESEDDDGQAAGGPGELTDAAVDWIASLDECNTLEELEKQYKEAYRDLNGDGYGRNQLMKAKDKAKDRINAAG